MPPCPPDEVSDPVPPVAPAKPVAPEDQDEDLYATLPPWMGFALDSITGELVLDGYDALDAAQVMSREMFGTVIYFGLLRQQCGALDWDACVELACRTAADRPLAESLLDEYLCKQVQASKAAKSKGWRR